MRKIIIHTLIQLVIVTSILLTSAYSQVYSAIFYRQDPVGDLTYEAGTTQTFVLAYTNTGTNDWKNSGGVTNLQYIELRSINSSGTTEIDSGLFPGYGSAPLWINRQRVVSLNAANVAPGENGWFIFQVKIPSTPGDYMFYFRPYHAAVGLIGQTRYFKIHVPAPACSNPTANFSVNSYSGTSPHTVYFNDLSNAGTGASIIRRSWNFGDGGTSSSTNPSHTYTSPGTYSAFLEIENSCGNTDASMAVITVQAPVCPSPTANFSISDSTGTVPHTVYFSDLSNAGTGSSIISRSWNFGDGGTSSSSSPSHIYTTPGTYTVTLRVENSCGNIDSRMSTITVQAQTCPSPTANFSISDSTGTAPHTVYFNDLSNAGTGASIISRTWNFGDVSSSSSINPSHTYTSPGTYTVMLKIENSCGEIDTETCFGCITVEQESPVPPVTGLVDDAPVSNITINSGEEHLYYFDVDANTTALIIKTENVTGDPVDLYIKKDSAPTDTDYHARSFNDDGNERIRIDASGADGYYGNSIENYSLNIDDGRYYILVKAVNNGGTYSLAGHSLELEFPFSGDAWNITRAYNTLDTHIGVSQQYSLDFAQDGCESYGKPIVAAEDGIALINHFGSDFGRNVVIDHGNGFITLYAHLATITAMHGAIIQKGQEIGTCGNTGNVDGYSCDHHGGTHLHFSFLKDSTGIKPEPLSGEAGFAAGQSYNGSVIDNPEDIIIIDDMETEVSGVETLTQTEGYLGEMQYAFSSDNPEETIEMKWRPYIPFDGYYRVFAHIPSQDSVAEASYKIVHADGISAVACNQSNFSNEWVLLGTEQGFYFNSGTEGYVMLNNFSDNSRNSVGFDAVMFTSAEDGIGGGNEETDEDEITESDDAENGCFIKTISSQKLIKSHINLKDYFLILMCFLVAVYTLRYFSNFCKSYHGQL